MVNRPRNLIHPRLANHVKDFWPDTCTIQSPSIVKDTLGGDERTYSNSYLNVRCRISRFDRQARVETFGEQVQGLSDWQVYFFGDQPITLQDRIVTDNLVLEPIDINDDQSFRVGKRVLCRELRTG